MNYENSTEEKNNIFVTIPELEELPVYINKFEKLLNANMGVAHIAEHIFIMGLADKLNKKINKIIESLDKENKNEQY